MKNLAYQTKQAFYFSLAFYLLGASAAILRLPFAAAVVSISLLVSMIWVLLVLREIVFSGFISSTERVLLILFVIFGNILAGVIYFMFIRYLVIGKKTNKK